MTTRTIKPRTRSLTALACFAVAMPALASLGCNQSSGQASASGSTAVAGDSAKMGDRTTDTEKTMTTQLQKDGGEMPMETATFGGGCFWGVELAFSQQEGVIETDVGFMGGTKDDPSYKEVCYTDTGHAEVVHLTFDPNKISYNDLLNIFWRIHDPTQVNRQGPDVGTQYRTVIFYHNDEQRDQAEASKKAMDASGKFKAPIATIIEPAATFWKAEDYHQDYLKKRGQTSCHIPNI